jgi:hypothetical protein
MKKHFLIIILFYCHSLLSQSSESKCNFIFDIETLSKNQILEMCILSYSKEKVWEFYSEDKHGNFSITANNWAKIPGEYILTINVKDKESSNVVSKSIDFSITGWEYKIKAYIRFCFSINRYGNTISDINIVRYYNSIDSVTIRNNWIPKSDGIPDYVIYNKMQRKIFGTGMWGNFFGWVEKLDSVKWRGYERGGFCGTSGAGEPIFPGDSICSYEGDFIGNPKPFIIGKYKYCVLYSFEKDNWRQTINSDESPDKKIYDLYLLEKEFEIK